VLKLDALKPEIEIKVEDPTVVPRELAFSPDGSRLVMVWMDGYKGTRGAMLFELPSGKLLKRLPPATHARVVAHQGQQVVTLTTTKTGGDGGTSYATSAYRTSDFKRLAAGQVQIGADLSVKQPPIRLLYWEPGHISLVGMEKGKYDKKRDIRLPERGVRYNLLLRKAVWAEEPKEVVAWTKATTMRPKHPGQLRFLEVSDDLRSIHFVDLNNELGSVTVPIKWSLYEPKSLRQEESWDGKTLYFSFTVDPVNPAAVKRQKADPERMDLYRLDPGPKATPLGQVLTGKQRYGWLGGTRYFAYLVKLKGFGRGGKELRLYKTGK